MCIEARSLERLTECFHRIPISGPKPKAIRDAIRDVGIALRMMRSIPIIAPGELFTPYHVYRGPSGPSPYAGYPPPDAVGPLTVAPPPGPPLQVTPYWPTPWQMVVPTAPYGGNNRHPVPLPVPVGLPHPHATPSVHSDVHLRIIDLLCQRGRLLVETPTGYLNSSDVSTFFDEVRAVLSTTPVNKRTDNPDVALIREYCEILRRRTM